MATRPSYFRERARNPYLRARPQPEGLEEEDPNASPLAPTFPRAMPLQPEVVARPDMPMSFLGPLLAPGVPGGERATIPGMPPPAAEPTPAPTLDVLRGNYIANVPTTAKGRIFEALKTAGLGFLQGAARDPDNPIAAGLGGAAAGGLISGISPRTGRAYQFETIQRPGIEDRMRREEERRRKQIAEEDRARMITMSEAQRRKIEAETADTEAQTKARGLPPRAAPLRGRPGDVFLDPVTKQPVAQIPAQEKPQAPLRARPGDVFLDPVTKEPITRIPADLPRGTFDDLNELDQLRQDAQEAWRRWSQPELEEGATDTPEAKLERQRLAQVALEAYNQAAQRFGAIYRNWFETGPGEGGWWYVQPRQRQSQGAKPIRGRAGRNAISVQEAADLLK